MATTTLSAGTVTYSGQGQAGNWSDAANWVGGVAPRANPVSQALFTSNATLNNSFTVGRMMMLGTEAITVNGTLNTTSVDQCEAFMICNGAFVTFAPTATLNDAGGLEVGVHAFGSFTAQGSGATRSAINVQYGQIGFHANSDGVVNIDDSSFKVANWLYVGMSGQGNLTVSDSGTVSVGSFMMLGADQGGTGKLTLSSGAQMTVGTVVTLGGNNVDQLTPAPAGAAMGTGTLTVDAGSSLTAGQAVHVMAGSAVVMAGGTISVTNAFPGVDVRAGATLSGFGTINVPNHTPGQVSGLMVSGTVESVGGTLTINAPVGGMGQAQIADGSTMVINGASVALPTINFMGGNGTLVLFHGIADAATLTGFSGNDHILMAGVDNLTWNPTTDVLTLTSASQTVDHLQFAGAYASNAFTLTQTSAGAMIGLAVTHTGH